MRGAPFQQKTLPAQKKNGDARRGCGRAAVLELLVCALQPQPYLARCKLYFFSPIRATGVGETLREDCDDTFGSLE